MQPEETAKTKTTNVSDEKQGESKTGTFSFGMFDKKADESASRLHSRMPVVLIAVVGSLLLFGGMAWVVRQYFVTPPKKTVRVVRANLNPVNPFMGHEKRVLTAAFSPDGKMLATGSVDNTVHIYNFAESNKPLRTLLGHKAQVNSVAFSPDRVTLASAGSDGIIKLWDAQSGKEIAALSHKNSSKSPAASYAVEVKSIAFSPDGKYLASGGTDGKIILWDAQSRQLVKVFDDYYMIWSIVFSPDGRALASAGEGGGISLWNVETGEQIKKLEEPNYLDSIYSIAFSSDGSTLASGDRHGKVYFWDVERGNKLSGPSDLKPGEMDNHQNSVVAVAFSPKNMLLATGSYDGTTKFWDAGRQSVLKTEKFEEGGRTFKICALAFSPDGTNLAIGDGEGKTMVYEISDTMQ